MTAKLKIWIALLTIYIFWGTTYLAIRFAVETIPPFLMAGTRFLIAGAILYIWRRTAGDPAPTREQWLQAGIVGLLLLLGGNGLVSLAEQHVASGISALIVGSVPLWMSTIEAINPKGARPNFFGVLGLVTGFGGVALLALPSLLGSKIATSPSTGVLLLLLAALSWSFGSIYSRHGRMPESTLLATSMEMLAGSAGLFVVGSLAGEWTHFRLADITAKSWGSLIYLVIFGSLTSFTSYAWLLRVAPVSLVSTYAYVNPLVAILLGALLASEPLTTHVIVSALIILGSVVLINLAPRLKRFGTPIRAK